MVTLVPSSPKHSRASSVEMIIIVNLYQAITKYQTIYLYEIINPHSNFMK